MNPRIVIGIGDLLGCGYYRVILPYSELAKRGAHILVTNELSPENLMDSDVLVLQRQHTPEVRAISDWYRAMVPNGKLVFEFDDNLHMLPKSNPSSLIYGTGSAAAKNMEAMIRSADMVTVSTNRLASEYTRMNKNIHACHNAIDPVIFSELQAYKVEPIEAQGKFRLGWAGSSTHNDDFMTILKPLMEVLEERPHVQFVSIGDDMRKFFPLSIRNRRIEYFGHTFPRDKQGNAINFSPEDLNPTAEYYKLLKRANLDAAVAPLHNVVFNGCKSYIKLIEYGLAGIPWIATRFGPYMEYTGPWNWGDREKAVGLNAFTPKEWKRAMLEMIDNAPLRQKLIENNTANIVSQHLAPYRNHEWEKAYESIGITFSGEGGSYLEKVEKHQKIA